MKKGKTVVDPALANRANVYLRMWTALEGFDPNADRWSEPTDFGSPTERIESAENAIDVLESRYRNHVDKTIRDDILRFRKTVTGLINGHLTFAERVAEFCEHLRARGVEASYASLKQAGAAGRSR